MRVGLVLLNSEIGGTEKRFANLFTHLSAAGRHDVRLLIPSGLLALLRKQGLLPEGTPGVTAAFNAGAAALYNHLPFTAAGVRVRGFTRLLAPLWRRWLRSSSVARAFFAGCDVVHYALPTTHLLGALPMDRPVVMEVQDPTFAPFGARFLAEGLRRGAFFNVASERILGAFEQALGKPAPGRARVSPCSFIDLTKARVAPKEKLIAFLGRLEAWKNPGLFIEALGILAKARRDFRACVLGFGAERAAVARRIAALGLGDLVSLDYHPRPQEVLAKALVFASLQRDDNYHSQALMEAMACGCAVVATDAGETWRLVSDDVGARVPATAVAVAAALGRLLDDPAAAAAKGRAAREKMAREQTVERYAGYLDELYGAALSAGRPAPRETT